MSGKYFEAVSLSGKAILVTGGGSGIGRVAANLFAGRGASVMVADISETDAQRTAAEIESAGFTAAAIQTDVSNEEQVEHLVASTVNRFGGLHGAFNCAGIAHAGPMLTETTSAQWRRVIEVNLDGLFYCMKHEIRHMEAHGGGSIVNVASCAAILGQEHTASYCASKAGVLGLTRAAMAEAAGKQVRVNALAPGAIETPMLVTAMQGNIEAMRGLANIYPMKRIGQPEDVAEAAAWLLSNAASFVNGTCIPVDGGYTNAV